MKKVLGCLLFAMLFFSVGYSQNNIRLNDGCADIEGIVLGACPSLEKMIKYFGNEYTIEHVVVDEVGPYDWRFMGCILKGWKS